MGNYRPGYCGPNSGVCVIEYDSKPGEFHIVEAEDPTSIPEFPEIWGFYYMPRSIKLFIVTSGLGREALRTELSDIINSTKIKRTNQIVDAEALQRFLSRRYGVSHVVHR